MSLIYNYVTKGVRQVVIYTNEEIRKSVARKATFYGSYPHRTKLAEDTHRVFGIVYNKPYSQVGSFTGEKKVLRMLKREATYSDSLHKLTFKPTSYLEDVEEGYLNFTKIHEILDNITKYFSKEQIQTHGKMLSGLTSARSNSHKGTPRPYVFDTVEKQEELLNERLNYLFNAHPNMREIA